MNNDINDKILKNVAQVIEFCKQKLASFKKPESIVVIDKLPRNSLGKPLKNILRDKYSYPIKN